MMSKLVFEKLYLYSTSEKQAKCIEFSDGINIISSSQVDGTDRGKSVIMRSLYHSLGADSQFDDKWDDSGKTYILQFRINDKAYYIYRSCRLFKFFDNSKKLLFSTVDRTDLAEQLNVYFDFSVRLPNRSEEKLEITPPAYNYLLYFIDQDYYNGTDFSSFSSLQQYANYKENVLYYHFGAFDSHYFEIIKKLEQLKDEKSQLDKRQSLFEGMFEKISGELKGSTYNSSIELLKSEIEITNDEYSEIVEKLSNIKKKLISLRNQKEELLITLSELTEAKKQNEKDISLLNSHTCPYCKTFLQDTVEFRVEKYNSSDDIVIVSNDIQLSILDLENKIDLDEQKYKDTLTLLKEYEEKLNFNSVQVNDILRHKGFIEVRDSLVTDMGELKATLKINKNQTDELNKEKKNYEETKKAINNRYYELLIKDKTAFGLSEIDEKHFQNIKSNFKASGSNKPIATVMWYMNLIKLKNEFNKSAIKFPIVFDSPNNAETDNIKRKELLTYLLKNASDDNQLIISTIGFNRAKFSKKLELNIISLSNEKYHLLNENEFDAHKELLFELCNTQLTTVDEGEPK
ncbi:hypothetical protein [Dehalobacter sp.]|uniref:hypothetical protein n=1 Tax=Dehalobacter sp. TaxID=1962289 RepID=UPI00258EC7D8|nr:hypothetical protein [Dehalobacter sp.]MDJ0304855.1 hypothetical protein [Dehalobacter sp.]